jgi:hypothetical protein
MIRQSVADPRSDWTQTFADWATTDYILG